MDHREIEESNIPDLYLMNKLPIEMKLRFEEHFVSCPQCLNRLEETEQFRAALKNELMPRPLFETSSQQSRALFRKYVYAFAGLAILISLGLGLAWRAWSQQRRESAVLMELRNRLAAESTSLEQEKSRNAELSNQIAALSRQQVSPPVFPLVITRGIADSGGSSVNSILLPQSPGWLILLLELPPHPSAQSYRATFRDSRGTLVSDLSGLKSISGENLAISVFSSQFTQGSYVVSLEGLTSDRYTPLGSYSFQVR